MAKQYTKEQLIAWADAHFPKVRESADDIVHGQDAPVERRGSHNSIAADGKESTNVAKPTLSSIMHGVVLPTSHTDPAALGTLKNEITKTLFLVNR